MLRPVAELIPNRKNARTHSESQIAKIAASITDFQFMNPVIIDRDGHIIAGHGRVEAAKKLGLKEVPCLLASHLTPAQKRAYMLADNRMALDAGWDDDLLAVELKDLAADGFDLSLTGFDDAEINQWLNDPAPGLTDEDQLPDVIGDPVARAGDIWLLGDHRVMCGDSTDADVVGKLLGSKLPHLMVTDPPYGVEYDAAWRTKIIDPISKKNKTVRAEGRVENDDTASWEKAWALFPGDVAYVWHAGLFASVVEADLKKCGFELRSQIIWAKNNLAISRGHYHWQHEPCWYAVRGGKTASWSGDRKQTTLWAIDKPLKSETGHSTQKPVECMRRPMINNSKPGDAIYDPFLGSGTTLIAAETEGRTCYGIEINPVYIDVIIKRWQEFTGRMAILESTGESFADASANRN